MPMLRSQQVRRVITTTTDITQPITAEQIRRALNLPQEAELSIEAPSGGNWSGMRLDIDTDVTLVARWKTVERREDNEP